MHESSVVRNQKQFTRSCFCWVDSLFAERILSLTNNCPSPSYKYRVLEWQDPDWSVGKSNSTQQSTQHCLPLQHHLGCVNQPAVYALLSVYDGTMMKSDAKTDDRCEENKRLVRSDIED